MNLEEFLSMKGTDLSAVVAKARATVGLEAGDTLLAVGSLVEGLGNSKSDLDLLLITPRGDSELPSREVALVSGRCLADVQILRVAELEELLARFEAWAGSSWEVTHAAKLTAEERRLLHRLLHGTTLHAGASSPIAARMPARSDLARLKLHVARHLARTIQVDMVGYRECGDYSSLVFAAQETLGHAVDALAAGHQLTNPVAKWRSRLLEALPGDWERSLPIRPMGLTAGQVFFRLHRAPERPDEPLALEHALRITTFARGVFAWAERRVRRSAIEGRATAPSARIERRPRDVALPYLDLDVDFHELEDRVIVARLNEFGETVELSTREFAVTLLFDGITTAREAELAVVGAAGAEGESRHVDRVVDKMTRAGFCAPSRLG
ncbi:hypothetical protein WMF30_22095 [Sorangium sp. So ce134]